MLIKPLTCLICQNALSERDMQCSRCHCVVQFTVQPPAFSRSNLVEALVQPVLEASRVQVAANPQDGLAHYILGLCYVNYELLDQGIVAMQRAAWLLPEKHRISFELAILHTAAGQFALGIEQIALAQNRAPDDLAYQYVGHYLTGMTAQAHQEIHVAVTNWMYAYQLLPDAAPARSTLTQFIDAFVDKLSQPIARKLRGLASQDAEHLRVLNDDPTLQKATHPKAPRKPGNLGSLSLGILHTLAPARAMAIEHMHNERLMVYQQASEGHATDYQISIERHEQSISDWQAQTQAIRGDLPTMARLCLAVAEEEERLRLEEARRQAETERRLQEVEQRRLADQQRKAQIAAQNNASALATPARQKPVREKQYFSTKAHYMQGLPKGKEKDDVMLTVSNLSITIKHGGMFGAWEHSFPTAALAEATVEKVKHMLSSEKRLRLSYLDERGMLNHTTFAQLNADDAVKQILKARAGT